jgi:TolB-like protein/Tfp pilus assembly protein PilF
MDFGAGREERPDRPVSDMTGTPLYMAPEVLEGKPASTRSDVYSVGVLLYRLLTGDYPVRGASLRDVRLAHEQGARGRLRAERPDLAAAFVRVIERALDPDPAQRFQSAADMGAALRALADRPARRRRALAAGLVLGLLAASLVWGLSRRDVSSAGMPPRLAVLPFATRGAPGDAALGVGLAHEVQRNLAHLEGLMLLSFNASPTFAAGGRALADVTSELQADLVVDGAVERRAEGLHVDARLVRTADQTELWRETFDRPDAEVFAILDEIARAIVDELRLELKLPRRHETSPDVFFLFLQAQAFQARRHENDSLEAARLFQQVVERDPSYAPAWAGLACALAEAHRVRAGDENRPPDPRMRHAAERAMELDPLLAPALTALGNVFAEDRNWARAEAAFRDAIAHNPSFTWAHTDYALTVLMPLNRADEALALLAEAISRDPASLDVRRVLAHFQVNAGLYEDAIATSRWVLARDPTFPWVDLWLGRALTLSGRPGEAVPIYAAQPSYWAYLGYAYAVMGRRDDAEALAASHDDPRGLMLIYSGLGETERAIQALQQLAAVNPWRAASWLHRPEMAPIRSDPRVAPIIRQLTGSD